MLVRRRPDSIQLFCVAIAAILLIHPDDLTNGGFQISFAAVLGMILFAQPTFYWFWATWRGPDAVALRPPPRNAAANAGRWIVRFFVSAIGAMCIAWLMVIPLIAYHYGQLNTYSALAGVILLPVTVVSLLFGLAKIALTLCWPGPSHLWAVVCSFPVTCLRQIVELIARIPGSKIPLPTPPLWMLFVYYALFAVTLLHFRSSRVVRSPGSAPPSRSPRFFCRRYSGSRARTFRFPICADPPQHRRRTMRRAAHARSAHHPHRRRLADRIQSPPRSARTLFANSRLRRRRSNDSQRRQLRSSQRRRRNFPRLRPPDRFYQPGLCAPCDGKYPGRGFARHPLRSADFPANPQKRRPPTIARRRHPRRSLAPARLQFEREQLWISNEVHLRRAHVSFHRRHPGPRSARASETSRFAQMRCSDRPPPRIRRGRDRGVPPRSATRSSSLRPATPSSRAGSGSSTIWRPAAHFIGPAALARSPSRLTLPEICSPRRF